ncbi:hypothetical protein [Zobellella sp. DQSA1]|uniref:hypothetical protein n=1 Tax=Zobellella sp. DQSA1 TaxID=3342386 RepID=UPI0035BF11B6
MFSTAAVPWRFGLLIDVGLNDVWLFSLAAGLALFAGLLVLPVTPSLWPLLNRNNHAFDSHP